MVIGMLLTSIIQSLAQHHCFTQGQKLGMKIRANVCHAVYKKVGRKGAVGVVGGGRGLNEFMVGKDLEAGAGLGFSSVRGVAIGR